MARLDNHGDPSKIQRHTRREVREPATFYVPQAEVFLSALDKITQAGWAIRFGRTRDGGALAIGIYGDGPSPYTDYLPPGTDVLQYILDICDRALS